MEVKLLPDFNFQKCAGKSFAKVKPSKYAGKSLAKF